MLRSALTYFEQRGIGGCRSLTNSATSQHLKFARMKNILQAVVRERIGERHASACRYKDEVPEGLRRSARRLISGHAKYSTTRLNDLRTLLP